MTGLKMSGNRINGMLQIWLDETKNKMHGIIETVYYSFQLKTPARVRTPGWSFLDQSAPHWYMIMIRTDDRQ